MHFGSSCVFSVVWCLPVMARKVFFSPYFHAEIKRCLMLGSNYYATKQFKYESILILWNYLPSEKMSVLLTTLSHEVQSVGFRQSAVGILGFGNSSLKFSSVLWDCGRDQG